MLIKLLRSLDWDQTYCSHRDQHSSSNYCHNSNELVISISRAAIIQNHARYWLMGWPDWEPLKYTVLQWCISCPQHVPYFLFWPYNAGIELVLNCGSVICSSIMAFCFNLLQEAKCHAIRLFLQVEVRLDENIVPLSYNVRTQTEIGW